MGSRLANRALASQSHDSDPWQPAKTTSIRPSDVHDIYGPPRTAVSRPEVQARQLPAYAAAAPSERERGHDAPSVPRGFHSSSPDILRPSTQDALSLGRRRSVAGLPPAAAEAPEPPTGPVTRHAAARDRLPSLTGGAEHDAGGVSGALHGRRRSTRDAVAAERASVMRGDSLPAAGRVHAGGHNASTAGRPEISDGHRERFGQRGGVRQDISDGHRYGQPAKNEVHGVSIAAGSRSSLGSCYEASGSMFPPSRWNSNGQSSLKGGGSSGGGALMTNFHGMIIPPQQARAQANSLGIREGTIAALHGTSPSKYGFNTLQGEHDANTKA